MKRVKGSQHPSLNHESVSSLISAQGTEAFGLLVKDLKKKTVFDKVIYKLKERMIFAGDQRPDEMFDIRELYVAFEVRQNCVSLLIHFKQQERFFLILV